MDAAEHAGLAEVEQRHWFYRGKRRIARHWLQQYRPADPADLLLDIGCGTGRFVLEWTACAALGTDAAAAAAQIARQLIPGRFASALSTALPFADGAAQFLTALDVLEHVADDRAAFAEMMRVLSPGGVLLVTVPAMPALWSDWDVALGHHRRYTRDDLLAIVPPGLEVLRCSYFNDLALLPVLAVRALRRLWRGRKRMEDRIPPAPLNRLLEYLLTRTGCATSYRPPAGVSLLLLARKP